MLLYHALEKHFLLLINIGLLIAWLTSQGNTFRTKTIKTRIYSAIW